MAKKKQTRGRKKAEEELVERSPFWPLAGAILLCVIALFLLFGGFGTGGPLPKGMFHGMYLSFGWAAYLVPFALVYWAVVKFQAEEHHAPLGKLISMVGVLVFTACWLFTAFASKQPDGSWASGHGGFVGKGIGGAVLAALDSFPASIMFAIFVALAIFFAFGISPKVILSLGGLFRRRTGEEGELAELKHHAEAAGFKLNEGVPVEHHSGRQFAGLRNSAEKLAPAEDHSALTLASDPNWQFPAVTLLDAKQDKADAGDVSANAKLIAETFANFNIEVEMEGANVGPRVTQYTLKPPANVKLTKITALENNLALDLA
ncbi:MAG TPA: DNA translocase FtsK 4TM domain-containing protein, partial [Candidatus Saccharimonadales bacterium]|nr:DNA translocase FtsK 4TM domain-containing protein [Candidatus Saccharimonadales bacterium]